MKELKSVEERKTAILEAIEYRGGIRILGREIGDYFQANDIKWVSLTVDPMWKQKLEGVARSINLFIRDHMQKEIEIFVIGSERLHTLREQK